jgi:hypothetical protein
MQHVNWQRQLRSFLIGQSALYPSRSETIEQLAGTWEDAKRNEQIQQELEQLAKSGNDIPDRGAYLDALRAGADAFVTSDKQLVGTSPAARIQS